MWRFLFPLLLLLAACASKHAQLAASKAHLAGPAPRVATCAPPSIRPSLNDIAPGAPERDLQECPGGVCTIPPAAPATLAPAPLAASLADDELPPWCLRVAWLIFAAVMVVGFAVVISRIATRRSS